MLVDRKYLKGHFDFEDKLASCGLSLKPTSVTTLQVNITRLCNQACLHCHVDASPRRREMMSDAVMDRCLDVLRTHSGIETLDVTGGAPELHSRFRYLVAKARVLGKRVIVRHNLTVTLDPHPVTKESLDYLPAFFAAHGVEVVSSLPCYEEERTDKQRGTGVFQRSIDSLLLLNDVGYGKSGSGLVLNLVYNPVGTHLPPPEETLEKDYKRVLRNRFGIEFNRLYALTNLPVHRFKAQLIRAKGYEEYMETLVEAFNPVAAVGVMCRTMISVGIDGELYDCDFNQMLDLAIGPKGCSSNIFDFDERTLVARDIQFASHCFGCSAGAGSSCLGSTAI